ncbi:hypothetical protein CRN80_05960 [Pseudomonas sp. FDAARGOS_380]|nr:hypothetical protein CRN80_05960 [Pseudomonas sp. FDAARGOS_380]
MARALAPVTAFQPKPIYLKHRAQNVGAGLPAIAADQLALLLLIHRYRRQASSHSCPRPATHSTMRSEPLLILICF